MLKEPVLEACYGGKHRMMAPETGKAVEKVQHHLVSPYKSAIIVKRSQAVKFCRKSFRSRCQSKA